MLSEFKNLPGQYVVKEDGNLRIVETVPGDVTLVIGTAPEGPTGLYLVTDTSLAEQVFDSAGSKKGTLLKGMYEALESGSRYVALFRIGATPVTVDFVNGYTIIVNDASASAGTKYKLFYSNDFNGGEIIRVYDASIGTILYDSVANIDNGQVLVLGSQQFSSVDKSITIGFDFQDGSGNPTWQNSPTLVSLKDFTAANSLIGNTETAVTLVDGTKTLTVANNYYKAGQVLNITSVTDPTNDGSYIVEYVIDNGDNTYTAHISKKVAYSAGNVSEVAFTQFNSATDGVVQLAVKYLAPSDGLSMTLNEKFAAYAQAYWELEAAKVDMVVPAGVHLDEPNVVDNENRYHAGQAGYIQPTGDFLGKAYEFEHEGMLYLVFKNSFANASDITADELPSPYQLGLDGYAAQAWLNGTLTFDTAALVATAADVTNAVDDISYSECNFAHQLASYIDGLSTNDNEASGVIGVTPPDNFSKAGVSNWLGKSPVFSSAGVIVKSGAGVLGNKFRAGSLGRLPGFFRTSNGYVDSAPVMYRNQKIDIGRNIDIVATPLVWRSSYNGTSSGVVTPAAGIYGGTIMNFDANVPTTNKKIKADVSLAFGLAKKYLDQLTGTNYVTFTSTNDNFIKVVDAPTAALSTSDYNRRSVCRVSSAVIDVVRSVGEPYIGSITSPAILKALEDQINNRLKELQSNENQYILGGLAVVKQTSDQRIKGEAVVQLQIVTAGELRRLTIYLQLSK